METDNISLLKMQVENTFGRKILTSADCEHLYEDILRKSGIKISFNTIRRYFNFMKASNRPSAYILDAFSNYCGFSSFDSFVVDKQKSLAPSHDKQDQIVLEFLTSFFKNIEVNRQMDLTYLSLVQQTILNLEHYPSIIDAFQKEIAKTKNGQTWYFEHFVHIDKLASYYGNGLICYLSEKKTKEAQVFGHSLLCTRSWLTEDNSEMEHHYQRVIQNDVDTSTPVPIGARYFAVQLYYADLLGLKKDDVLLSARQFYLSMKDYEDQGSSINCFEIILAEALVLTGQYEEALFYTEEVLSKVKSHVPAYIDVSIYENINLLKAIAFVFTRRKKKAHELLQLINPYEFNFLSRQYLNILYLLVKQTFKASVEEESQLAYLVKMTGFSRLLNRWHPGP